MKTWFVSRLFVIFMTVGLLAGCASTTFCNQGGHNMLVVENSGWYLLSFIPIASGDVERPNESFAFTFFNQTTTLENNMKMIEREMARRDFDSYKDLTTYTADENVFIVLLKRRTIHSSVELLRSEENR